jgi:hypothetical protein
MLRSIKQLYRDKLGASDGETGQVKDSYFDDRELGGSLCSWLSGRSGDPWI